MNVSETTYITITNRVRISAALENLRQVTPGFDGVTTKEGISGAMRILCDFEQRLFVKLDD